MRFAEIIEQYRIFNKNTRLTDVPIEYFPEAQGVEIRRTIALTVTQRWLESVPGMKIDHLPRSANGHTLCHTVNGVELYQGTRTIASYDFAFEFENHGIVAKVKSSKLRRVLDQTEEQLREIEKIYGSSAQLFIFAPLEGKKRPYVPQRVHLFDLGYGVDELRCIEQLILQHKERI